MSKEPLSARSFTEEFPFMTARAPTSPGILLLCGAGIFLTAVCAWAGPPYRADGPVPGLYLGADSRGYPYYPGYRDYPGYPYYRGYPDYFGYPCYPRKGYAAGYQPRYPYVLEFFGLHPAIWRFTDYFSGTYPSYYAGGAPDFRGNGMYSAPAAAVNAPLDRPSSAEFPSPYSLHSLMGAHGAGNPHRPAEGAPARVVVHAPAAAEVSFDGWKTALPGMVGRFSTSKLEPGNVYSYDVTARWQENGRPVTRKRQVFVTAGATVDVDFSTPAEATAK
jgi:uncharacterized protein (TIGR03000 family)